MGDAAYRRIAELEADYARLEERLRAAYSLSDRLALRVAELEKKLVERDVYEAEQRLPPEQAALIKHLKTVERCLEDGREEFSGYDIEVRCVFCLRDETDGHDRGCHWLALQFDRKPEATMTMVHEHALNEHATWKRRQGERNRPGLAQWLANAPPPAVYRQPTIEELRLARIAVEESRERLMAQPFHGVNVVPAYSPRDPEISHAFSVLPPEQRRSLILGEWPEGSQVVNMTHDSITVDVPVAPSLGIGGEEPAEVAPPDDEDVP